jgi:hypothetical protein
MLVYDQPAQPITTEDGEGEGVTSPLGVSQLQYR